MKFSRSLSVPGPDDIPPPPTMAPPEPPLSAGPHSGWRGKQSQQPPGSAPQISSQSAHYQLYSQAVHFSQAGRDRGGTGGAIDHPHPFHSQQSRAASRKGAGYMGDPSGAGGGGGRAAGLRRGYSNAIPPSAAAAMSQQQMSASQQQMSRVDRSNTGAVGGGGVPKGGGRRGKGPLVKQSKVEDGTRQSHALGKVLPEKSSIPIPTIIVKAPSTSSSGRSSQGSSVEAEPITDIDSKPPPGAPAGPPTSTPSSIAPQPLSSPLPTSSAPPSLPSLCNQENLDFTSQFGAAIVGAARRDRERFREARRKSASFFLSAEEELEGGLGGGRTQSSQQPGTEIEAPSPRLRPSKSIDEGMFSGDTFIHHTRSMPPAFGLPEYSSPAPGGDYQPKSVPGDYYGSGKQPATTFIHPLTGKVLDPSSPLGLALAARERALKDDGRIRRESHFGRQLSSMAAFPSTASAAPAPAPLLPHISPTSATSPSQSASSSYLVTSSSLAATTSTMGRPPSPRILRGGWGEDGAEKEKESGPREGLRVRFSEDKTVHTHHFQSEQYSTSYREREREKEREGYGRKQEQQPAPQPPYPSTQQAPPRRPSFLRMESDANAYVLSLTPPSPPPVAPDRTQGGGTGETGTSGLMVLPPPALSVDADDEFVFADPLPPPLQFANSFDRGLGGIPGYNQQGGIMHSSQKPPPPPPPPPPSQKEPFIGNFPPHTPLPSPQAGDSTASSLTSYDSEVANLTQSAPSPSPSSPHPLPLSSPSTLQPTTSEVSEPPSISPPPPSSGNLHRPFPLSHSHHLFNSTHASGRSSPTPPPLTTVHPTMCQTYRSPSPSANSGSDRGSVTVPLTVSHATTTATTALTTTTATTSLSELAVTTTTTSGGGRRADDPPPPTKSGESQETVVDSGIEELDSRSSSDHHLDNILGIGGARGDGVLGGEGERGSHLLDSYMTCLDGQTFEMHNAKSASSTYPKLQRYRDSGSAVSELRRHTSTAPASFRSQKRRDEEAVEAEAERAGRNEGDEMGDGQDSYSEMQNFDRPSSIYFERPHTPELKPQWGEGGMGVVVEGVEEGECQGSGMFLEGRKLQSPLSSMKASIISELSSKLQQMGNKGMEGWESQRSLSRHRFSEDSSTCALSPPTARSPSPLPTSPCQPHQPALSPTPSLSSQSPLYPSWTRSPSPQPSIAPSQPQQAHPPLSPSYSPYPTSPKHRASYRNKALEFQFIPSRESRSYPHLSSPPSSKPFASKPLPYWTKYDVADWLGYLNLGEHRERFLDNEIDGTHLPSLTKEDYLDLGVTRVGHRMNIERALKRLLDRLSSPFPVSALSPREGQTERRRDEGTRS
ncbi:hypothetical protein SKAU_G00130910 [Synaphobranchus kaupii]|uniref:SAM domain-containing protein n=1 Tax=Synaphobranchus kaupii TaxID=118154 RepID=A0A9Q1FR21_SYNKA|nr:hypothetical protein SKAU_G00130910 [Synaphobranchus kaupii]